MPCVIYAASGPAFQPMAGCEGALNVDVASWAALLGLGMTMLGLLFTFFRFVGTGIESVRTELAELVRAARSDSEGRIEKIAESELKSRHVMIGNMTTVTSKIEADIDRLKRETVRREEMTSLENRMNSILMKIETKLEGLVEKFSDWRGLVGQIKSTGERLVGIAKRFHRSDQ